MEPKLHPLASHDLPYFITAPGETDRMMVDDREFFWS